MGKKKQDQSYQIAMNGAKGTIRFLIYICIAVAIVYVGKTAYSFGYSIFNQIPMEYGEGRNVTVVIPEGTSAYSVGKILKEKGLIEDARIFLAQVKLSRYKNDLQAGTFVLSTSQTADEIMEILAGVNTEGQPEEKESKASVESAATYDSVDAQEETEDDGE